MGLFSKFKAEAPAFSFTVSNEREAWIVLMYAIASSDGEFSDAEVDYMSRLVVFKSFFVGYDTFPILRAALQAKDKIGIDGLIDAAIPFISDENRAAVLACSVDLVMADGTLGEAEEKVIEKVSSKLNLETSIAEKIIEVMMFKNKYNRIIVDSDDEEEYED